MADPTDSEDAAAAAAGYQVLLDILKPPLILEADVPTVTARLQGYYDASLTAISNAGVSQSSIDGGVAVGNAAAQEMIAERTGDGRYGDPSFDVGFDVGEWRPLAEGLAGNNFYWVGQVVPFLVPDAAMFGTRGPNAVTSAKYTREFNRVKSLGAIDSTTRRAIRPAKALFWADHAIGMWTRIFRQLSVANQLSTAENARYFGMLYLTVGDAVIACNLDKAKWGFWRPTTAIREAATDGNPLTEADATWESLNPVPPYPEHPSGHNCGSWSIVETLKDFYGTNQMTFDATRTFPQPGPDRSRARSRDSPRRAGRSFERASSVDCTSGPRKCRVHDSAGGWRTSGRSITSSRSRRTAEAGGCPRTGASSRPFAHGTSVRAWWSVGRGGIEPPTPRFSAACSTD